MLTLPYGALDRSCLSRGFRLASEAGSRVDCMQPPSIKPVRTIANPRIPISFLFLPFTGLEIAPTLPAAINPDMPGNSMFLADSRRDSCEPVAGMPHLRRARSPNQGSTLTG